MTTRELPSGDGSKRARSLSYLSRWFLFWIGLVSLSPLAAWAETREQLFRIRPDGTGLEQLTHTAEWDFGNPDWSPDGRRIVVDGLPIDKVKPRREFETNIVTMNADGSDLRDLGPGLTPCWSPDGTQIVFSTLGNPAQIVVMNADGTGREQLAPHWGDPRWSPQAHWIASMKSGDIALLDLATGTESTLGLPGQWSPMVGFRWSPDGRRIAFVDRELGLAILTLDEKGRYAGVRRRAARAEETTSWSPDGRQIVFTIRERRGAPPQLYVVSVAGNDAPQLLPGQRLDHANFNPDWSPDGKWILFCSTLLESAP